MKNIIFIIMSFTLFLSVSCFSASGKIYSWIDEDGVQHFTDAPTCSVEQESKGTAPFMIDSYGRKQVVQPQNRQIKNAIDTGISKKAYVNNKILVQQAKPTIKSGGGQKNINIVDIFISSLLPIFVPLALLILFLLLLQLVVGCFLKSLKSKRNNSPDFLHKKKASSTNAHNPQESSSELKGFEGEQIVIDLLYGSLDRGKYHFFNDLILPENEGSTQIDHLIVSEYGIFIIETKNMKGAIYGNPYQKNWTQWLADGKHPFQNPFHQNYKHKKCLEKLLKIESDVYFQLIVFTKRARFPKGKPDYVFYPEELIAFMKAQTKIVFSSDEVNIILSDIDSFMVAPSFETYKRHKEYVKSLCDGY